MSKFDIHFNPPEKRYLLSQINILSQKKKDEAGVSCGCIGNRLISTKIEKINQINKPKREPKPIDSDRKFGDKGVYS